MEPNNAPIIVATITAVATIVAAFILRPSTPSQEKTQKEKSYFSKMPFWQKALFVFSIITAPMVLSINLYWYELSYYDFPFLYSSLFFEMLNFPAVVYAIVCVIKDKLNNYINIVSFILCVITLFVTLEAQLGTGFLN